MRRSTSFVRTATWASDAAVRRSMRSSRILPSGMRGCGRTITEEERMGGEPWFHVAPYQPGIRAALEALRNLDADSTASILDIDQIAHSPEPTGVTVVSPAEAQQYFGIERPTRADV